MWSATTLPPARVQAVAPEIKSRFPAVPVIVVSGYSPGAFVSTLREAGVDEFLPLPVDEATLLSAVTAHLTLPAF